MAMMSTGRPRPSTWEHGCHADSKKGAGGRWRQHVQLLHRDANLLSKPNSSHRRSLRAQQQGGCTISFLRVGSTLNAHAASPCDGTQCHTPKRQRMQIELDRCGLDPLCKCICVRDVRPSRVCIPQTFHRDLKILRVQRPSISPCPHLQVTGPNAGGCMRQNTSKTDNPGFWGRTFPPLLKKAGYTTGMFGKVLNDMTTCVRDTHHHNHFLPLFFKFLNIDASLNKHLHAHVTRL